MTLVDTSVWVEHLRRGDARLVALLEDGEVACHPFVIGELALGHLRNRDEVLALLQELPGVPPVDHVEALAFIDAHRLSGSGLGWVDVHVLASALVGRMRIWTADRRLAAVASRLAAAWTPPRG